MMPLRHALLVLAAASLPCFPSMTAAAQVLLRTTWIKQHKDRVTTESPCAIDAAKASANGISTGSEDGDLHMACRCKNIGLPMVAEIVNAKKFPVAVDEAHSAAADKQSRTIRGVWRLWLEHPPTHGAQTQGDHVPIATGTKRTNPDHVFEIHPITKLSGIDLDGGFVPLAGFTPYTASVFGAFEKKKLILSRTPGGFTSIEGARVGNNYIGFKFKVDGAPWQVTDGWFANVLIDGGPSHHRRVVVADGTPPADLIAHAKAGDRFKALAIPRIDLDQVDAAISATPNQEVTISGAYELIVMTLAKAH